MSDSNPFASDAAKEQVGNWGNIITTKMNETIGANWKAVTVNVSNKKLDSKGKKIDEGETHVSCVFRMPPK